MYHLDEKTTRTISMITAFRFEINFRQLKIQDENAGIGIWWNTPHATNPGFLAHLYIENENIVPHQHLNLRSDVAPRIDPNPTARPCVHFNMAQPELIHTTRYP